MRRLQRQTVRRSLVVCVVAVVVLLQLGRMWSERQDVTRQSLLGYVATSRPGASPVDSSTGHFSYQTSSDAWLPAAVVERRQRLEAQCRRRGLAKKKWPRMPQTMLVSDHFKVMYCMIGKVASSTWKKVFLMAAGRIDKARVDEFRHRSVGARALKVLHPMSQRRTRVNIQRMQTYLKFVFVRHPYDRLLSAFNEKFRLNADYRETYGRQIIRRYRVNASADSLRRGHDVTLEEFVRFMVDRGRFRRDVHWTPQYDMCMPCTVGYDFIGQYETLWTDGDALLRRAGVSPDAVTFPRWSSNRTDRQRYEVAFRAVRPEYMSKLHKFYRHDFEFFGYT